jgi:hypothetical protein
MELFTATETVYYVQACMVLRRIANVYTDRSLQYHIQGVTGGTDQTSGGCSLC